MRKHHTPKAARRAGYGWGCARSVRRTVRGRQLGLEVLEERQLLSGTEATTEAFFEMVARAEPDEWYNGIGQTYVAYGDQEEGAAGTAKVNQTCIWSMTEVGDDLWFGTGANVAGLGQEASETVLSAIEAEQSKYPLVPSNRIDYLGDWRPPQIFAYDKVTGELVDKTPDDDLINETIGIRSVGANDEIILMGGGNISFLGINLFAFDAATGEYLGSSEIAQYGDIRSWVNVDGQLYAGILRTYSTTGEGAVLRWTGSVSSPFTFTEVGVLDSEPANLAVHEGRLYASTWPLWAGTLMYALGYRSDDTAGVWMSPLLGEDGLTASDANGWSKVWDVTEYEPDAVVAKSLGGGELHSFNGYLYWGTMQVMGTGASIFLEEYPDDGLTYDDVFDETFRASAFFRGRNFDDSPTREVELLYGDEQLPTYVSNGDGTGQWSLTANLTGSPTFGSAGFGTGTNYYTWSMDVYEDRLYVGTCDYAPTLYTDEYVAANGDVEALSESLGGVKLGADLWVFPQDNAQPYAETQYGAGNALNFGFRTMVATDQGLFLGTANCANLVTDPDSPLGLAGWELLRRVEADSVGSVTLVEMTGLDPSLGDLWYKVEATRDGYLSIQASDSSAEIALFPDDRNRSLTASTSAGGSAMHWTVEAGETYFVKLGGTSTQVDVWLANLVAQTDTSATIYGTDTADTLLLDVSDGTRIEINGMEYAWAADALSALSFDGGNGDDVFQFQNGTGVDTLELWPDHGQLTRDGLTVTLTSLAQVEAYGASDDHVIFHDRAGTVETFVGRAASATFSGTGFQQVASGFGDVDAYATAGAADMAQLFGSGGNTTYEASPDGATLQTGSVSMAASGFRYTHGYGSKASTDVAYLHDSTGNDTMDGYPGYARLYNASFFVRAKDFGVIYATATEGDDRATLTDSTGSDTFVALPTEATLTATKTALAVSMTNFDRVRVDSSGKGTDKATFYDSDGDDQFVGTADYAKMLGTGYFNWVTKFDIVLAYATFGTDTASLLDSAGDDTFDAWEGLARLYGTGFLNRVKGFDQVTATGKYGGRDVANFYDSGKANTFYGTPTASRLESTSYRACARLFEEVYAHSDSTTDTAFLTDSSSDDLLVAVTGSWRLSSNSSANDYLIELLAYELATATSTTGTDTAQVDAAVTGLTLEGNWIQ